MVFVHSLLAYRAHLGRVGYSQQNFMPEMERGKERERERERWRGREREEGSKSSVDGKELGWGSTVRGRERQRANQRQR